MRNPVLILITILLFTFPSFSQQIEPENLGLVNWLDLKTAQELNKKQPKPFLIDVYTDWCGWCKHMMKTTFSEQGLANYINMYYYPVRFDAETKDTVEFLDKKYINKNTGNRSANELATLLLEGKLSYPTIVFFNNDFKFKLLAPEYLKVKDIEPILVFTLEHIFNTTAVQDFRDYYYKAFYPDSGFVNKDTVTWLKSFGEAVAKNKIQKRKILLFISTDWCNGGKTMLKSTFNNSIVTAYINENFLTVYMDAQSMDSVAYNGQVFKNTVGNQAFHPFFQQLLGERIMLPTILFFDENSQYISYTSQYLTPATLNMVVRYFGDNKYLSEKWEDFMRKFLEEKK